MSATSSSSPSKAESEVVRDSTTTIDVLETAKITDDIT